MALMLINSMIVIYIIYDYMQIKYYKRIQKNHKKTQKHCAILITHWICIEYDVFDYKLYPAWLCEVYC